MTGERPKTWLEMKKSDEKTASERERGFKRTDYVGPLDDPQLWDLLEMWGNANPQNRPTMTEVVHDVSSLTVSLPRRYVSYHPNCSF